MSEFGGEYISPFTRLREVASEVISAYKNRLKEHSVESHRELLEHQARVRALARPVLPAEYFEVKTDWRKACVKNQDECDIMVYKNE